MKNTPLFFLFLKDMFSQLSASRFTNAVLVIIILSVVVFRALAATPNPGHPWTGVGDGLWVATGTTAARTFTFPDYNATVITSNSFVSFTRGDRAISY